MGKKGEVGENGVAEITLYNLLGSPSPTMRVRGKIYGEYNHLAHSVGLSLKDLK